jgi:2-polyprenyl-6-hydroxyphenyl methylase/3-demethylubiquinone-9 3-methyltransferase
LHNSINAENLSLFENEGQSWWDENGPFKPLHRLNPVRLEFITQALDRHFLSRGKQYQDLSVLDVGCGGGLLCEPLARLGCTVTGLDASPKTIETARHHAGLSRLNIEYQIGTAEAYQGEKADVVMALEIVEHVNDPAAFVQSCVNLVKPGGLLFLSTLNKTWKSYLVGILGAEYILRWIPKGTHDWNKFLPPSTLGEFLEEAGSKWEELKGISFSPLSNEFYLSSDLAVNYIGYGIL